MIVCPATVRMIQYKRGSRMDCFHRTSQLTPEHVLGLIHVALPEACDTLDHKILRQAG